MKTVNAYTDADNTTDLYIDVYGDIFWTLEDAQIMGVAGKVIVDNFYVGTPEEMKKAALRKWIDGKK